jgi:hypothetical protein
MTMLVGVPPKVGLFFLRGTMDRLAPVAAYVNSDDTLVIINPNAV